MKKFKFQGTVDVFMQCKMRACALQPCGVCRDTSRQLAPTMDVDLMPMEGELGREQAGLLGTGTGFGQSVSSQCRMSDLRSPCHSPSSPPCTVHVTVSCQMHSHVGSAQCLTPMHSVISGHDAHSLDRIIHEN